MLTTIVVVLLFFVAFLMVAYEWATYLWVILLMGTIITWLRTVYIEHVKKNVKDYEKVYNLFVVLRGLTVVSAIILGAIWILTRPFFCLTRCEGGECNSSSSSCFMKLLQKCVFYLHYVLTFATFCYKIL